MIKDNPEERATCLEILEEKNLWALNEQDFDFLNEWNCILDSYRSEKRNTIYSILALKVCYLLEKQIESTFLWSHPTKICEYIAKSN